MPTISKLGNLLNIWNIEQFNREQRRHKEFVDGIPLLTTMKDLQRTNRKKMRRIILVYEG